MSDATSWILIRDVDQLADRVLAIARDVCRHTLRDRDHLAADDEHAVIASFRELLDDNALRVGGGAVPGFAHGRFVGESRRDAAAVTQVERLEDDGEADFLREPDGFVGGRRDMTVGDGEADRLEHALRIVLVLRDLDGDGARVVRERRLDAPEIAAESELDERP